MNDEGQIVIETTPYSAGPQRLIGVREWKKKDKEGQGVGGSRR
jgi:hypothetical protein